MNKYFWNILISIDQFVNAVFGGDPDETMSSRMGKLIAARQCLICKFVCTLLDRLQINHCAKSIELDEGKDAAIK